MRYYVYHETIYAYRDDGTLFVYRDGKWQLAPTNIFVLTRDETCVAVTEAQVKTECGNNLPPLTKV